jgi:hypothetical protein
MYSLDDYLVLRLLNKIVGWSITTSNNKIGGEKKSILHAVTLVYTVHIDIRVTMGSYECLNLHKHYSCLKNEIYMTCLVKEMRVISP